MRCERYLSLSPNNRIRRTRASAVASVSGQSQTRAAYAERWTGDRVRGRYNSKAESDIEGSNS
jgi:hypothetical protein